MIDISWDAFIGDSFTSWDYVTKCHVMAITLPDGDSMSLTNLTEPTPASPDSAEAECSVKNPC